MCEDWQGPERYSLVFFTNHLWDELPSEAESHLKRLGFPWPQRRDVFEKELIWPERRMKAARRSWRRSELVERLRQRLESLWRAFRGSKSSQVGQSPRSKRFTCDLKTCG